MTVQRVTVLAVSLFACLSLACAHHGGGREKEAGFKPLFNGKDLTGWTFLSQGDKGKGYAVENGILVAEKGVSGNLLTEKDYDNFILRFDFKLEPNGNNGIGIHAPTTGGAVSYDGIEIQILDDDGEEYKGKIKSWQHNGSVYGCVAAKPGSLKPVGEWNSEEIVVDGRNIKVTLNGNVIVDTNLDRDVTDPEVIKKHPGLARTTGKIGLLGHSHRTEFRNIRVKELPRK